MAYYGFFNRNFNINEQFFVTIGTTAIIGGAGIGWRHSFNDSRITPFVSTAAFGAYILPMCEGDCDIGTDFIFSGAAGLNMHAIKSKKINVHFQIGMMSLYSLGNAPDESASNIPGLLPVLNVKFAK